MAVREEQRGASRTANRDSVQKQGIGFVKCVFGKCDWETLSQMMARTYGGYGKMYLVSATK